MNISMNRNVFMNNPFVHDVHSLLGVYARTNYCNVSLLLNMAGTPPDAPVQF